MISKSSNPTIRVTGIDTIEHVTDYASAGDHTRTLEKFQELGVALSLNEVKDSMLRKASISVFEPAIDNTAKDSVDPDSQSGALRAHVRGLLRRWKFTGPSVTRLSEGEFNQLLHRELKRKRGAFRRFLESRLWKEFLENERGRAIEQAKVLDGAEVAKKLVEAQFYASMANSGTIEWETFQADYDQHAAEVQEKLRSFIQHQDYENGSDLLVYAERLGDNFRLNAENNFSNYMQLWLVFQRADSTINSGLNTLIRDFLDIPKDPNPSQSASIVAGDPGPTTFSTHPSAGLGYLRTNSVLENHPLLGPRAEKSLVEARVLQPKAVNRQAAILGVAGIATREPTNTSGQASHSTESTRDIDLKTPGGGKIWVSANNASIDSEGRVRLAASFPSTPSVNVRANTFPDEAKSRGPTFQRSSRATPLTSSEVGDLGANFQFDKPLSASNSTREISSALDRIRQIDRQNEQRYANSATQNRNR